MSDNPYTVLLVDDEEDILLSMKDLLEGSLPEVTCQMAFSGRAALQTMSEQGVDLVLTDFKMPGMTGLELLDTIRDRYPATPRMLMTAFPDLDIAIQAINEARVEAFLTKPVEPEKVIRVVQDALREHGHSSTQ